MLYINCVNLKQFAITKSKKTCPEKRGGHPILHGTERGGRLILNEKKRGGRLILNEKFFDIAHSPPLD